MTESLIPCAASRSTAEASALRKSARSARTSGPGRFQLSPENAKSVRVRTPRPGAAFTTRRTASAPRRCPAVRGSPRAAAQRPLPSMMIATWSPTPTSFVKVLFIAKYPLKKKRRLVAERAARRADDRLHVIEIALEGPAAVRREPVLGPRAPAFEGLGARHVLRLLELAGVDAQVAVRRLHQRLEIVEAQRGGRRQRAQDAEPQPMVDQRVELARVRPPSASVEAVEASRLRLGARSPSLRRGAGFSHRSALR